MQISKNTVKAIAEQAAMQRLKKSDDDIWSFDILNITVSGDDKEAGEIGNLITVRIKAANYVNYPDPMSTEPKNLPTSL